MMKSSTLRCSLGSIQSSALNLPSAREPRGTKQPIWQERSSTSNSSMRRAPLLPAISRDQLASTPHPSGVTRPSPVMTMRSAMFDPEPYYPRNGWRRSTAAPAGQGKLTRAARDQPAASRASSRARILFEKFDGVADGLNLLGGIVGNLTAELFLEGHHQFDRVQAVGAEIVDEACVVGHLVGFDPKVLDNDFLHALCDVAHRFIPRLFPDLAVHRNRCGQARSVMSRHCEARAAKPADAHSPR